MAFCRLFVFRFFLECVEYFGQKRRGHAFCVRQEYDIDADLRELLDHIVVHVGALPVRPVKESVEMVLFPRLHFVHGNLRDSLVHAAKLPDDRDPLLKRDDRSPVEASQDSDIYS